MTAAKRTGARACGTVLAAGVLSCALLQVVARPTTALAGPMEELQEVQAQIQESRASYDEAAALMDDLQGQIDANEQRIAELEQMLPATRERAAASMRSSYKMQQRSGGLVDLLLSSGDFYDLLATIQYLDVIQEHNNGAIDELLAAADELEVARVSLDSQMDEAESAHEQAQAALDSAEDARARLQEEIAAQAAAEEAERRAALEAARRAAEEAAAKAAEEEQDATFTNESGGQATVEVPTSPDPGSVDMGSDRDAFVAEWSARIDAYLAGSPLAGQGKTFAEAAWEFGVDPRLSPAISMIESSQGRHCFLPHNAWGWGSSSWDSWEEAIWEHVEGLAIGYGGQLTYAGAQKYCPPNADFWYAGVLANLEKI